MMAYTVLLVTSVNTYKEQLNHPIMSDVGKLLPTKIKRVESATDEHSLIKLVQDANVSERRFLLLVCNIVRAGRHIIRMGRCLI